MQYVLALVVGLLYGGWPILANKSGGKPFWIGLSISLMTVVTILVMGNKNVLIDVPKGKVLWMLALAGLMNGVATWYYGRLVGTPGWSVSTLIAMSMMTLIVTTTVCGFIFEHQPITAAKILGLALALPAIWLMSR
jgi:drug/metabolite transporter (DMT)-like permease